VPALDVKAAPGTIKTKTKRFATAKLIEKSFDTAIHSVGQGLKHLGSSIMFAMPMHGQFTSPFGYRRHPFGGGWRMHKGIDISTSEGTPVGAAAEGIVSKVTYSPSYGRMIVIRHAMGYETLYAHLSRQLVSVGQQISQGQTIGREGSTGMSTGPHLHFEIHKNGRAIDPEPYIRRRSH
jgi:murein DD-endopeptidase MepM/ murein hydrolase activator NlpD